MSTARIEARIVRAGIIGLIVFAASVSNAQPVYPTAVLPFQERGSGMKGMGDKVADILFAQLVVNPDLYLVERSELDGLMKEHEINLSGMVRPDQAVQVGQLTGAKILVTGSVIQADKTLYFVAKVIGTETSRVLGQSVKGNASDEIAPLVEQLAEKVAETITKQSESLVAKQVSIKDRIEALKKALGSAERPSVVIKIPERHVGQVTIDPAAETELTMMAKETGFTVIDPEAPEAKRADILIEGEGFSEFAVRRGNLISVKARLEVKAINRETGEIMATDRQTAVEVDLTEQIAGKKALQIASATIAERILPKLVGE
jgi:TolB-like protein